MGRQASCRARLAGGPGERWGPSAEGKALLETDEVIFRGAFRARVPLDQIRAVVARAGALTLTWPEGKLELELGAAAEKWADAIRHPRSVLDKLGIAPGLRVALLGGFEAAFVADVSRALGKKPVRRVATRLDLVFLALARPADEARLKRLVRAFAPDGALWAVYPRGRPDLSEDTIRRAARAAGLVDVKVVRFSGSHGALKLVVPRAARARFARGRPRGEG